ncbi:MAG: hypothetical protein C0513_07200 [Isosphaera sp.]|nr:hypothetical protein [Isosphaera sp.]
MDVAKGMGGNKAARVRARKKMQEIKAAAQDVRQVLLAAEGVKGADGQDQGEQGDEDAPAR